MPASALDLKLRSGGGASLGLGGGSGGAQQEEGGDVGGGGSPNPGQVVATYTLPEAMMTSGILQDADGVKVKKIWGCVRRAAGTYFASASTDDAGDPLADGVYTLKVLAHNWDPTVTRIHNNSVWVGQGQNMAFRTPFDYELTASDAGVSQTWGYTESKLRNVENTFAEGSIWRRKNESTNTNTWDSYCQVKDETNDVLYVFVVNNATYEAGVIKYDLTDDLRPRLTWSGLTPDAYSFDTPVSAPTGSNFAGEFLSLGRGASAADKTYLVTRMAVQRTGNVLALAMPNSTAVKTVHKTTGATVYSPVGVAATAVAWAADEALMWVGVGNDLSPYSKANWLAAGSAVSTGPIVHSFNGTIIDLRTDWGNGIIAAAFGGNGASMQIASFDDGTGTPTGDTFGQADGYASASAFAEDKLHFGGQFYVDYFNPGGFRFYEDGSLLIFNAPLRRLIKVADPWGTPVVTLIASTVGSYGFTACVNNHARLFVPGWLELSRDYTTDPSEGTEDGFAVEAWYGYDFYDVTPQTVLGDIFIAYESGGKTFCEAASPQYRYELTSSGVRQITAITNQYNFFLDPATLDAYRYNASTRVISKASYTGLDGSSNPTWGTASTYMTLPSSGVPLPNNSYNFPPIWVLSDGSVLVLGGQTPGTVGTPHLARFASDGTLLWKELVEVADQTSYTFPTNGDGTDDGNNPPPAIAVLEDYDLIIVSWSGEFWRAGQSSSHIAFNLDGIPIEKLGNEGLSAFLGAAYPQAMQGGNALKTYLVDGDSKPRYIFNSENGQSALTECRFETFSSVQVKSAAVPLGASGNLGSFTASGVPPDLVGAKVVTDACTSLAAFTDPGSKYEIYNSKIRAKNTVSYDPLLVPIAYRTGGGTVLNSNVWLDIPNPFNGQGQGSPPTSFQCYWGAIGRYDPATGRHIRANCYFFYPGVSGTYTEYGAFRISFGSVDDDGYVTAMGTQYIGALPSSKDHDYLLGFIFNGDSPTRMSIQFWDRTTGVNLMKEMYTTLSLPEFGVAGYNGIALTYQTEIEGYAQRSLTWSGAKTPFLVSL